MSENESGAVLSQKLKENEAIVRSTGGGVTGQEPQEVELQDRIIGGGIRSPSHTAS